MIHLPDTRCGKGGGRLIKENPTNPARRLPGCRFLGVGGDFDGQLDGLLQGVSCPLVHWLHRLDVNAGDDQEVLGEDEVVAHLVLLIQPKDRGADDLGRVLKDKHRCTSLSKLRGICRRHGTAEKGLPIIF